VKCRCWRKECEGDAGSRKGKALNEMNSGYCEGRDKFDSLSSTKGGTKDGK
jgi:hypothetical protein